MIIRDYRDEDAPALRAVFVSSVHEVAAAHYGPEQLAAWAPIDYSESEWAARIGALRPFVAAIGSEIVGYADLQPTGYIDHFFVSGKHARRGIGAALMLHIHQVAMQRGINALHSNVSRSAEEFFKRFGFELEARQSVIVRGVVIENAAMRKALLGSATV